MRRGLLALPLFAFVGCSLVVDVDRFNSGEGTAEDATSPSVDSALAESGSDVSDAVADSVLADTPTEVPPTRPPQVFVAGGSSEGVNVTTVVRGEIVDGKIAAWATLGDNLSASASSTQATRSGNRVFILGPDFNTLDTHTVRFASFDGSGKLSSWSGQKGAFEPHGKLAAASSATSVYVIGGQQDVTDTAMPSVYVAPINSDGTPGVFTTTTPMPAGRGGACAVVVGDSVYVFGGYTGTTTNLRSTIRGLIGSSGAITEWRPQTDMANTTVGCSAVAVGKKVFVLGGYGAQAEVQYATVGPSGELGPFTSGPRMPSQHAYYQAAVAGGYVVVAGGFAASSTSSAAVEIAPISEAGIGTWSTTTSLPKPRHFVNAFGFD